MSGRDPWTTTRGTMQSGGNAVDVLVDGRAAFAATSKAILGAKSSIRLLQMEFDPDFVADFPAGPSVALATRLREAAGRGVDARVLLSQTSPVDVLGYKAAERALADCPNLKVHAFPLTREIQHAKIMVVDGTTAFVYGSLFVQAYDDAPTHDLADPRRGAGIPLVGPRPVHDVSVRIQGPAVAHLDKCFADLWNHQARADHRAADVIAPCTREPAAGAEHLQIVRTLPRSLLRDRRAGETDVLESYLRGLSQARNYVYLENQYITNPTLAKAVRDAVDANASLQVILLLNPRVDIPAYMRLQERLLKTTLSHPRIAAFSAWSTQGPDGHLNIQRTYIHSKTALIDDAWACLGTANLDGFSLDGGAEVGLPDSRNVETNIVWTTTRDDAAKPIAQVRRRLWEEHLGPARGARDMPAGGWLRLWQAAAKEALDALGQGHRPAGRVLPFAPSHRWGGDRRCLERLGVETAGLDVRP